MSYARSPRALCSTTIGTRCPMCSPRDLLACDFSCGDAAGLLDQLVDRFRPDDAVDEGRDVRLERLHDLLARLPVLRGERVQLGLDVRLRRLDPFLLGDRLDQEGRLDAALGLRAGLGAKRFFGLA